MSLKSPLVGSSCQAFFPKAATPIALGDLLFGLGMTPSSLQLCGPERGPLLSHLGRQNTCQSIPFSFGGGRDGHQPFGGISEQHCKSTNLRANSIMQKNQVCVCVCVCVLGGTRIFRRAAGERRRNAPSCGSPKHTHNSSHRRRQVLSPSPGLHAAVGLSNWSRKGVFAQNAAV